MNTRGSVVKIAFMPGRHNSFHFLNKRTESKIDSSEVDYEVDNLLMELSDYLNLALGSDEFCHVGCDLCQKHNSSKDRKGGDAITITDYAIFGNFTPGNDKDSVFDTHTLEEIKKTKFSKEIYFLVGELLKKIAIPFADKKESKVNNPKKKGLSCSVITK